MPVQSLSSWPHEEGGAAPPVDASAASASAFAAAIATAPL